MMLDELQRRNYAPSTVNVRPNAYSSPRVSPGGDRVAVQTDGEGDSHIWIYDLSGDTQIRQLTQAGNNVRPIWTPDGEWITFASDRDGPLSIYQQRADGSGVAERLTTPEDGTSHWPDSWYPAGEILSFTSFQSTAGMDGSIWNLSPGDGEPELFYDNPEGSERLSQFSPAGRWLAFSGGLGGGSLQVFVKPFPDTGALYPVTQDGGAHPGWSPDGTEIFYRGPQIRTLRVVDVQTESGFTFGAETELGIDAFVTINDSRDYDMLPDGERFIVVFPTGQNVQNVTEAAARLQINIVLNWIEELKERVPVP